MNNGYYGADAVELLQDDDGNVYEVGALPKLAMTGPQNLAIRPAPQVQLRPVQRPPARRPAGKPSYLPITATAVAAGASETINVQPTVDIDIDDLLIPDSIAPDFVITQINTGLRSIFIGSAGVPAELFAATADVRREMEIGLIKANAVLTITVTNIAEASRTFRGSFTGSADTRCG